MYFAVTDWNFGHEQKWKSNESPTILNELIKTFDFIFSPTYDKLSALALDLEHAICLKQQLGQSERFAFATLCQNFVPIYRNCELNFRIDFIGQIGNSD